MSIQGGAAEENVVCTAWDISQPLMTETVHLYEDIGEPWQSAKWSKVGTEAGFLLHGSSFLRNVKSYHVWKQDQQMAVPRGGREKMRRCQSEVPIVSNAILSTLELFIGLDGSVWLCWGTLARKCQGLSLISSLHDKIHQGGRFHVVPKIWEIKTNKQPANWCKIKLCVIE